MISCRDIQKQWEMIRYYFQKRCRDIQKQWEEVPIVDDTDDTIYNPIYADYLSPNQDRPWVVLLEDLNQEIIRLEKFRIIESEKKERQEIFALSLRILYDELKDKIEYEETAKAIDMPEKKKADQYMLGLPAAKLAFDTLVTLRKLDYSEEHQAQDTYTLLDYKNKYEVECCKTPLLLNFAKAVGTIIATAIGFIGGAVLGLIAGSGLGGLSGTMIGIGIGEVVGGMVGAVGGAAVMYLACERIMRIKGGEFTHFLTGSTPIYSAAEHVGRAGLNFFSPCAEHQKSETVPCEVSTTSSVLVRNENNTLLKK